MPLLAMLLLGADKNWDLANYHLYNPHAWLTGRYATDIAPAQVQTWHNPLLDIPLYLLVRADAHSLLISLWLTIPAIVALLAGTHVLQRLLDRPLRAWELVAFALAAASGAAFFPGIGSTMNDSYVAAGVLVALALVLRAQPAWWVWLLAGAIAGFTAGLKLTAALYCIGLFAATLASGPARALPVRVLALGVGGLGGFLLSYLPWGLYLWETHGNPMFPYFNNVFRSPDLPPEAWADQRFRPKSLLDALLVPVRLLTTNAQFSEIPARDPRLLIGLVSAAVLAWPRRSTPREHARAARMVVAFFVVSYVLWVKQYGILRYTGTLEVLAVATLIALLSRLPGRTYLVVSMLMVAALVFGTVRPDWGRRPFTRHFLAADWPTLTADAMVVTATDAPLGFFMLGLPDRIPALAIRNNIMDPRRCAVLQARVEARLSAHRGPIWLLEDDQDRPDIREGRSLAREYYGLQVAGKCTYIRSTFGQVRLCPLQHSPATTPTHCALPMRARRQD
ncbi:MAG TPA: hypothetical protein VLC71_12060 [Thermomonas sp.]|nr:hypothetical protein [Thermomonas sp.]